MASTVAAAIAEVEGTEFDLRVGYLVKRPTPSEVDPEVRDAFAKVNSRKLQRSARMLAALRGADLESASDAVQEAILYLLESRNELFRTDPDEWWGLLYKIAEKRLIRLKSVRRPLSIDHLLEEQGDVIFFDAKPCIPESGGYQPVVEGLRLPKRGERWSRERTLAALHAFEERTGRPPRSDECRRVNLLPSLRTIYSHFDSLADALLEAGMVPPRAKSVRRNWTPVTASKKCLSFRWRQGRWPDGIDVRANTWGLPGYSTMIRYFGGVRAIDIQLGTEAILDGFEEA